MTDPHSAVWQRALLAARIAAIGLDRIGGIHLRARAGPVRDAWISYFKSLLPASTAWRRVTPSVPPGRLIGGLDVARTLEAGRPRLERGLLAATDRGILVLSMAERASADFAATIGTAMDNNGVHIERNSLSLFQPCTFTLLCLDEGADQDETLRSSLADRLAISIDLSTVTLNDSLQVPDTSSAADMA
ncbi:MAG: magnesium chelatase ATPase subunit D, partial [Pseudomonadota bacterium]